MVCQLLLAIDLDHDANGLQIAYPVFQDKKAPRTCMRPKNPPPICLRTISLTPVFLQVSAGKGYVKTVRPTRAMSAY